MSARMISYQPLLAAAELAPRTWSRRPAPSAENSGQQLPGPRSGKLRLLGRAQDRLPPSAPRKLAPPRWAGPQRPAGFSMTVRPGELARQLESPDQALPGDPVHRRCPVMVPGRRTGRDPAVGFSAPAITLSVVDLPAPVGGR